MATLALVCARCQPPTNALAAALAAARAAAPRVAVLCMDADDAIGLRTPWTAAERRTMLRALCGDGVPVLTLRDVRYDRARWAARAAALVATSCGDPSDVIVFGDDGESPTALPLPAGWRRAADVESPAVAEAAARAALLDHGEGPDWDALAASVPAALLAPLRAWTTTPAYAALAEEAVFIRDYRQAWSVAPYPPNFVTVDAIVTWRDQLLLIERGRAPGRGLWALPGGFVDPEETIAHACVRELSEETGLDVTPDDLQAQRFFDDPSRSLRGRIITHVHHYALDALPAPPDVAGGDDAAAARWWPMHTLAPDRIFSDHYFILQAMLGID